MPSYHLTIKNQLPELYHLKTRLDDFVSQQQLSPELAGEIMLVSEELLANTICYGYTDDCEHTIDIEMTLDQHAFSMTLTDDASAYNPLLTEAPLLGQPALETALGGLGIPLIRALSDEQHYQRRNKQNVFIFTKLLLTDG